MACKGSAVRSRLPPPIYKFNTFFAQYLLDKFITPLIDPDHDEFSVVNTVLSVGAAAAIIIGGKEVVDSMGNSYSGDSYAWDWQPGNQTWVCRNRNNGQYASHDKCPTLTSSTPDGWP